MAPPFGWPVAALFVIAAAGAGAARPDDKIPFPEDYRDWRHVKSEVITPGHKLAAGILGIHHIYANDAALEGYETGEWLDGAIVVFDLFSYEEKDNALVEGKRKQVDVMFRSPERFGETGGWGYAEFSYDQGVRRRAPIKPAQCHACHSSAEGSDSVFSEFRR